MDPNTKNVKKSTLSQRGSTAFDRWSIVFQHDQNAFQTGESNAGSTGQYPSQNINIISDVTMTSRTTSVGRMQARARYETQIRVGCGTGRTVRVKTHGPWGLLNTKRRHIYTLFHHFFFISSTPLSL